MARRTKRAEQQAWERPNLVLRWVVFENTRGNAAGSFLVMDPSRERVLGMPAARQTIPTVNVAMTEDEMCSALESMVFAFEKHVRLTPRANRIRERAWEAIHRQNGSTPDLRSRHYH